MLLASLLVAACVCCGPMAASARQLAGAKTTSADVIVIGAGMSGAKAARDLAEELGAAKLIVLEARNRLGGRTWTRELVGKGGKKIAIDLGAAWIHGVVNNPLVGLAAAAGVPLASRFTDYENGALFKPDGTEASDAEWTRWEDTFGEFEDAVAALQEELDPTGRDPGLGSAVAKFASKKGLKGLDRLAFNFTVTTTIEHEYAASVANLSLFYDSDTPATSGGDKFVVGGFQRLAEHLLSGLDVRLGHKVTAIDSSRADRISVSVAGRGTFTAKRVVVALPAAVLRAGKVAFKPSGLPAANKRALGMLGSGLLNKCVLVFDRVFWDKGVEVINRIPPANETGAWEESYSMWPITGEPVLVGFNAADYARALERRPAAAVKDEMLAALRRIYRAVPEPLSYTVTAWGKDEFALGSYSYTKAPVPGYDGFVQAHVDTARPMAANRIFFAGEHTRIDVPATVAGAYLSGKKAAADLIAQL